LVSIWKKPRILLNKSQNMVWLNNKLLLRLSNLVVAMA
jgi:hypothetical protein